MAELNLAQADADALLALPNAGPMRRNGAIQTSEERSPSRWSPWIDRSCFVSTYDADGPILPRARTRIARVNS